MKQVIFFLFAVLSCQLAVAQLNGIVFFDSNSNGIKDNGEQGVAGAVVSDGYNVIHANADGSFSIPGWEKQRFVTLYPGADYYCERTFIPVEENVEDYIFCVYPKKVKEDVTFVQISDTETYEYRDWVDQLKQYIKVHNPDFVIHTGDICYKSGMEWHSKNITSQKIGVPFYYCLGNHDLVEGDYGEQFYEKCFGPAWYAFQEGNTLYVITPMMGGDRKPGFTRKEIGGWLKNLLKVYPKDQPKIFFNHDLLTNGDEFKFNISKKEDIDLSDYNLKAWLYGHWHVNMIKRHGESGVISYGTSPLVNGGIDHSPTGFRVVDVDQKGNTTSYFRWTYLDRQIRIVSPNKDMCIKDSLGNMLISANIYHSGSKIDSVLCGLWGEEGFNWKSSMDQDRWSRMSQNSDWNWSVKFKPGNNNKYVVVMDAYLKSGEVLHAKKQFVVQKGVNSDNSQGAWYNMGGNKEHDPVVKVNNRMPYQLKWSANVGSNIFMSSTVLFKNCVLTSSFDDGNAQKCYIVCFDARTGQEMWRVKTLNGVKSQMVISDGLVVGTDMQGITYAIDILSGKLKWKRDLLYNRLPGFVTGLVTYIQALVNRFVHWMPNRVNRFGEIKHGVGARDQHQL